MENDIVKSRIEVMFVIIEIGSPDMYLNIPCPFHSGYPEPGIEEIGACIAIVFTRIENINLIALIIK